MSRPGGEPKLHNPLLAGDLLFRLHGVSQPVSELFGMTEQPGVRQAKPTSKKKRKAKQKARRRNR